VLTFWRFAGVRVIKVQMFNEFQKFDRMIMVFYFPMPVCGKTPVRHSALQSLNPFDFIPASRLLSNTKSLINPIDVDRVAQRIKSSIAQSVLNQFRN
jgi:hypothetical protein